MGVRARRSRGKQEGERGRVGASVHERVSHTETPRERKGQLLGPAHLSFVFQRAMP